MTARVHTGSIVGIEGRLVVVEVDLSTGIPNLIIVGLPDSAINEAKERVKAAIKNAGFAFPLKKVVINLAPADLRKEGTRFDLPLAMGILMASELLPETDFIPTACFVGELSLEGSLRAIQGTLSLAMMAKEHGYESIVVPEENLAEASLVEGIQAYGISHLDQLPALLENPEVFCRPIYRQEVLERYRTRKPWAAVDFSDIKGQSQAKRALEIAAAGGHNILMAGPPGSGKSMLAKAFSGILPPLDFGEMLEVSRIYSVSGLLPPETALIADRPFRSPHHTASMAGLTGGGPLPRPGEITLAHRGVLFLDELVEFPRNVLEILRQPLEDGVITISRAQMSITYPAQFTLVAAMNPCPCGYRGDSEKTCQCTDEQIKRYLARLSGPLLDRFDLQLEVPRLTPKELIQTRTPAESTETIRGRVLKARERQRQRFGDARANAEMSPREIKRYCQLGDGCLELLHQALQRLGLSARAYDRILRLSRTIADLAGADTIEPLHISEALQYRGVAKFMPGLGRMLQAV